MSIKIKINEHLWHVVFFSFFGGLVLVKARERMNWEGREMFRFLGCAPQVPVCQFTNKQPARQWGETAGSPVSLEHLSLPPLDTGFMWALYFKSSDCCSEAIFSMREEEIWVGIGIEEEWWGVFGPWSFSQTRLQEINSNQCSMTENPLSRQP